MASSSQVDPVLLLDWSGLPKRSHGGLGGLFLRVDGYMEYWSGLAIVVFDRKQESTAFESYAACNSWFSVGLRLYHYHYRWNPWNFLLLDRWTLLSDIVLTNRTRMRYITYEKKEKEWIDHPKAKDEHRNCDWIWPDHLQDRLKRASKPLSQLTLVPSL